jgi:NAD dependent epimerase/dehydratase family enzyme
MIKFGLGGVMGSGKQYFSWIHIQDVLRAIEFILENENISGGVNFASPNPVTNYDWTKGLGSALWR